MRIIIATLLLFPILFAVFAVLADGDDQDWARDAVLSGKAVPLAQIIEFVEDTYDGKIYEVDLLKIDDARAAPIYRLKLVSDDGFLIDLMVDAASGDVVGIGGRGIGDDDDDDDEKEHDD